jgi:hypothetical protein
MGTLPGGLFDECLKWHSAKMDSLPSAIGQTLGKDNSFAECHNGHSAKPPSPSPSAVTTTFLCRVPEKKYSAKKALPMHCLPSLFYRLFLRLRRVLKALGKAIDSGSESNYGSSWLTVPHRD